MIDALSSLSSLSSLTSSPLGVLGSVPIGGVAPLATTAGGAASFADTLMQVATDAVGTLKKGEATAISGIEGKASVQQVVEAVMGAEQTVHTAIAIRDKLVGAYQEISRMAI